MPWRTLKVCMPSVFCIDHESKAGQCSTQDTVMTMRVRDTRPQIMCDIRSDMVVA